MQKSHLEYELEQSRFVSKHSKQLIFLNGFFYFKLIQCVCSNILEGTDEQFTLFITLHLENKRQMKYWKRASP